MHRCIIILQLVKLLIYIVVPRLVKIINVINYEYRYPLVCTEILSKNYFIKYTILYNEKVYIRYLSQTFF